MNFCTNIQDAIVDALGCLESESESNAMAQHWNRSRTRWKIKWFRIPGRNTFGRGPAGGIPGVRSDLQTKMNFLGRNHSKFDFQQLLFSSLRLKSTFCTSFGCLKCSIFKSGQILPSVSLLTLPLYIRIILVGWSNKSGPKRDFWTSHWKQKLLEDKFWLEYT